MSALKGKKQGTHVHLVYGEKGHFAGLVSVSGQKKVKEPLQCAECTPEGKQQCPLLAQESSQ